MKSLKIALTVILLASLDGTAWSQSLAANKLSEQCLPVAELSRDDLERDQIAQAAAVEIARKQAAAAEAGSDAAKKLKEDLEAKQNLLIETIYRLECLRPDMDRADEIVRGTPAALTMTLFYATNRQTLQNTRTDAFYGSDDTRKLAYGTTAISIPSLHKPGELELPSLWKLEWSPNPARHFIVRQVTPLAASEARAQMALSLGNARSKSLLLFVHGYNVAFREASFRTAQLAYDLRFPGTSMFYSWPSAGRLTGYFHDEESAYLAKQVFSELLDDLLTQQFDHIYIVAHSMGSRIVGGSIADRIKEGKDVGRIREILLAAPDINVEIFKSEIAPRLAALPSMRKTIYASSRDVALKASHVIHGFSRVGDTRSGVFVHPGFETIDASEAAPQLRSFGHSYVLDSAAVLNDLEDVIIWRRPIPDRLLRAIGVAPNLYWSIK